MLDIAGLRRLARYAHEKLDGAISGIRVATDQETDENLERRRLQLVADTIGPGFRTGVGRAVVGPKVAAARRARLSLTQGDAKKPRDRGGPK